MADSISTLLIPTHTHKIWAIYYKSLTWFKGILGRIPLLNRRNLSVLIDWKALIEVLPATRYAQDTTQDE